MIGFIIVGVISFLVVMVMLSRMGNSRKKEAIADLERERASLHTPDIIELVNEEVREAGIGDLPGAEGIDKVVLLRVWKRDRGDRVAGRGRFTVAETVEIDQATEADVTFDWE